MPRSITTFKQVLVAAAVLAAAGAGAAGGDAEPRHAPQTTVAALLQPDHDAEPRHAPQTTVAALLQPDHDAVGCTAAIYHGEPYEAGPPRLEE